MAAKLVVIAGASKGQVFPVPEDKKITIGRGDTAEARVNDPAVSRAHCTIEWSGGQPLLKDAGSKTGTRVNGKAITAHELRPAEVINVGTTQLRFQWEPPPPPAQPEEAEEPEELRVLSGTKLAHYQVGEVAGVGNSGMVFRARDLKEDREVALKVYLPEFAQNDEDLQRFIRAVKTMLPMRHSNLVTLYGGGKTGPYCWMAMEYVEGESLTQTIARIGTGGKLDWRPALRVALDVSRGLYYIHSERIIHRNLSPGNILFSRQGSAKLGSLILAKALSGALAKDVTVGADFGGDIRFLAPEQAGAGGPVDGRADLYSLGTLVYALLTGKPPFEGKNQMETASWILEREPAPPRQVDPNIPAKLEELVLHLLAKKPADRHQSAADLLAALEQLPKV